MIFENTHAQGNRRSSAPWKGFLALMFLMISAQFGNLKAQGLQESSERRGSAFFGLQSTKPPSGLDGSRLGPAPLFPTQPEAAGGPVAFSPVVENPGLKLKPEPAQRTPLLVGLYMAQIVLQSL